MATVRILLFIIFSVCSLSLHAQTTVANWNQYASPNQAYSFRIPHDWTIQENNAGDVKVLVYYKTKSSNDLYDAAIRFLVNDIGTDAPDYMQLVKQGTKHAISQTPNSRLKEAGLKKYGTLDGLGTDYTHTADAHSKNILRSVSYTIKKGTRLYTVRFLAPVAGNERLINIGLQVLNSFAVPHEGMSTAQTKPTTSSSLSTAATEAEKYNGPAGTLHAQVKKIKADVMFPFNQGAAVIKKGTVTALVNPSGGLIVPFGVYDITGIGVSREEDPVTSGLFEVRGKTVTNGGFINQQGKLVYTVPVGRNHIQVIMAQGGSPYTRFTLRTPQEGKLMYDMSTVYLTSKGHLSTSGDDGKFVSWGEDKAVFYDPVTKKMGFKSVTGQIIIPAQFDRADNFNDGMAAVGKKNEFGELKWGFVDVKGKLVIPFKYSIRPFKFSNGLSLVQPVKKEEFQFAYINKNGDIVIKVPVSSSIKMLTSSGFRNDLIFNHGYAIPYRGDFLCESFNYGEVVDSTGKFLPGNIFLAMGGVHGKACIQHFPFYNHQMYYTDKVVNNETKIGLLNIATGKNLPPIFTELSLFDPVSKLAYAKLQLDYDKVNNRHVYREGYINEQGVFVIVKGEEDIF